MIMILHEIGRKLFTVLYNLIILIIFIIKLNLQIYYKRITFLNANFSD